MQNVAPSPSPRRASTGVMNVTEAGISVATSGGVLNLGSSSPGDNAAGWNSRAGSSVVGDNPGQSSWSSSPQAHAVLQRRHSAPIPVVPSPEEGVAATAPMEGGGMNHLVKGDDLAAAGASSTVNDEFSQPCGGDPGAVATATGWAPPAPPPSPMTMTDQFSGDVAGSSGLGTSTSIRDPPMSFDDQDSAWWAPLGRITGAGLEPSQTPVSASMSPPVSAPVSTIPASVSSPELGDVDGKVETSQGLPLIMGL